MHNARNFREPPHAAFLPLPLSLLHHMAISERSLISRQRISTPCRNRLICHRSNQILVGEYGSSLGRSNPHRGDWFLSWETRFLAGEGWFLTGGPRRPPFGALRAKARCYANAQRLSTPRRALFQQRKNVKYGLVYWRNWEVQNSQTTSISNIIQACDPVHIKWQFSSQVPITPVFRKYIICTHMLLPLATYGVCATSNCRCIVKTL